VATTSMTKNMKASVNAELSTLYEISSLRFSESEKSFAREVVEKAASLFGVSRLALYAGNGADRRLIASLSGPDKDGVSDLVDQDQPNRCQFALGVAGKLGTLYVEQEQAIDSRQRRLYHVFARQVEQSLKLIREAAEHKQIEEELRQSDEYSSTILNSSPNPMLVTNPDSSISYVNPAFEALTGFSLSELIDRKAPYPWWTEETRDSIEQGFKQAFREGVKSREQLFKKKNGERFWVEVTGTPVILEGQFRLFLASWVDVTERKRMEEELRQREARLAELYNEAPVGYHELDREGRMVQVNQTELDMLGYTADEMLGKYVWDFMVDADVSSEAFAAKMAGTMPPGKGFERTYRRKDGANVTILIEDRYVKDENGQVVGLRSTMQDITARKRAEQALKESEEKFSRVFHSNPHPMSLVTLEEGRYLDVNDSYVQTFGFPRKELLGRTSVETGVLKTGTARKKILQALRKKQAVKNLDVELYTKSGRRVDTLLSGDKMEISGQTCLLCVISDITERKRMEEALRESEERYRDLFENASDLIQSVAPDGHFIYVNRSWREKLGYREEDIKNLVFWDIIHPDSMSHCVETFQKVMAGETIDDIEAIFVTKDEKPLNIEGSVNSRSKGGKIVATRAIFRDITERKRMEEEILKFKKIADVAAYGLSLGSPEGELTYVNESFARIHGYTPDELIGKHFKVLYNEEQLKDKQGFEKKLWKYGSVLSEEVWHIRKDGAAFLTLTSANLVKDDGGNPLFTAASVIDITERKKMEQALRESEEKLNAVVNSAGANIHMLDKDCNIIWTNQATKNMYGEDIIGRKCYEAFHQKKEPCQPFPCPTFQAMQDGKTHEWENQVINKDGQKVYVSVVSSVALRDEEGNPQAVVEVNRDITDRKQVEEAIRESEERYRALVNLGANIGEAVVMLQDDERGAGMHVFVSEEWTRITGYSKEELLNMSMSDIIHLRDRATALERHKKRMRGEELPGLYEISIIKKDGTEVPVEVTFAHSSYKGKPANVGYIRDITERKALEQQLQKKMEELENAYSELQKIDQMKDSFLSTVSHELRTPLTSIKGFAEILLSYDEDKETQKEFLNIINEESERLTRLIDDLLDLARLESGRQQWETDRIAVTDVITQAVHAVHSLVTQKGLNVQTELAPDLPGYMGDKDRLIQVVTNLLSNAIKFTPEEGEIKVKAEIIKDTQQKKPVETIRVSVSDTGIGIEAKDQKAVFERFKQVGDTMTDKPKGTGLGLPICKEIVEHYGGRMWVESELGKGSIFYFTLPLDKKVKAEAPEPKESKEAITPKVGKTILVVDDEDHVRRFLSHEFTKRGYRVFEATNGQEAITLARKQLPDLITLDILMPEIDGYDVTAVLKNDAETKDIPILIISVIEDKEKAFHLGANDYLTKPFKIGMVIEKISKLLRQAQKTVLVVDDDKALVKSLKYKLEKRGISTYVAYNGKEALQVVDQTPPHLILLDIIMPEMDGYEVMSQLKRNQKTAPIPIIVLTGVEIDGGRVRALSLGADDYVTKSDGLDALFENIEAYINND
jgi:PAS domain S-box-containing protein